MTNIDFDHPDYFKDINDVFDAFQEMAHNVKKVLLLGVMMNIYVKIEADVPIYYYGFKDSDDIYAQNIQITDKGTALMCMWMVSFMITSCLHNMVTIQF